MPFVRIDLRRGCSSEYRQALSAGVHRALIEALQIPEGDRFQVITEHDADGLIFDATYFGVQRSDKVVFVQITMAAGRRPAQKRKLFKRMSEILAANPGVRPEDLFVNLVEVAWENWSFGKGEAQYTV